MNKPGNFLYVTRQLEDFLEVENHDYDIKMNEVRLNSAKSEPSLLALIVFRLLRTRIVVSLAKNLPARVVIFIRTSLDFLSARIKPNERNSFQLTAEEKALLEEYWAPADHWYQRKLHLEG